MKLMRWLSGLWRSLENPSVSPSDEAACELLAGGARSTSGVVVTHRTALTWSPVWRGVNLISNSVAKLPIYVYRREGAGKHRDPSHPAYRVLRRRANTEMKALTWKQLMMTHALLHRGGYSYIVRDGAEQALELIPLDPAETYPVRENGRLWYVTRVKPLGEAGPGELRRLHPIDVFHIHGLSWDGLTGLSVVDMARQSLGLGLAQEKFSAIYFANNAKPPVVLKHPRTLAPGKRKELREQWLSMQAGIDKAHLPALLENGLDLQELSVNAADAQLIDSKKFSLVDVANWLGLPPHKVGGEGRTAYASLEQENEAFLADGLDPWLCQLEEEAYEKLLTERQKELETHTVEFLRQALVRANMAVRSAYYRTATGGLPWLTQNEVRALENLNPIEGGDVMAFPLNMSASLPTPEPQPDPEPQPPPQDPGDDAEADDTDSQRAARLRQLAERLVRDACRRACRRIGVHAAKAARDSRTFLDWLEQVEAEHRQVIAEMLDPALDACDLVAAQSINRSASLAQWFANVREALTHAYDTASREQFPAAVDDAITRAMTYTDPFLPA